MISNLDLVLGLLLPIGRRGKKNEANQAIPNTWRGLYHSISKRMFTTTHKKIYYIMNNCFVLRKVMIEYKMVFLL